MPPISPLELIDLYRRGRYVEAEQHARAILIANPDVVVAANVLGSALLQLRRPEEAVSIYASLVSKYPQDAYFWNNFGTALQRIGQLQGAERAFVRALALQPNEAGFLANLGFLHIECRRLIKARQLLLEVVQRDPGNLEARIHAALTCLDTGEALAAEEVLAGWQQWSSSMDSELQVELAGALLRLGRDSAAEQLLRGNLEDERSGFSARARLVTVLERLNRLNEADAVLEQLPPARQIDDRELRKEIMEANAVVAARGKDVGHARELLEQLLSEPDADDRWRASTYFLLAKLCDKLEDAGACMGYLQQAHVCQMRVASQIVPELVRPDSSPLHIADFALSPEQLDGWQPVPSPSENDSPIFVVGFPRSGTTMLEQMLDAHPHLASMDERPFVQRVIESMQDMGLEYPEKLGLLDTQQCSRLRDVYWEAVSRVVSLRPGQRRVDKNPLTMLRLPMLARLFPKAKIIFALRHPCDVLLSCYMQNFTAPPFMALCSTLPRLATGYAKAMRFWIEHAELLKPNIYVWRYERAVEDFDAHVESLGAFLELEDVGPLRQFSEHAKRKGYISTPSYSQVIQPVYASSIGRWRRYHEHFEPVLPVLEPAMNYWGYEP